MFPLLLAAVLAFAAAPAAAEGALLKVCRLRGVEHDAWCGTVSRPLDPAQPDGRRIDIHFAVLPAVARNKKPDPVFFFAGGPGQSAIDLAGPLSGLLGRFSNRRDIVLVDQRGTGRSAPLSCGDDGAARPLREQADLARQAEAMARCRERLQALPYGDLRRFTTTIAMQDAEAVRRALGVRQVNVVGGSYGTRAALEYMRQFPLAVRRAVLDGVAPPDMVLPLAFALDAQASFDALLAACEHDERCHAAHPALRAHWRALLDAPPREVTLAHPLTGEPQGLTMSRDVVAGAVRAALYLPFVAAALPYAIDEAAAGRFTPLLGLSSAIGGGRALSLAEGMHFSVVCAEDVPRMAGAGTPPGDFGDGFARFYAAVCAPWPRGEVPAAFYRLPPAPAATLVLSGGADPVTPPRHGERVARALGAKARHVVVAEAGHGVMDLPCMRDVVFRFIDAGSDDDALRVDAGCAAKVPRPPAFEPPRAQAKR